MIVPEVLARLWTLLEIYSCSDSIKPAIQSNYKTIFSNTDADAIEKASFAVLSALIVRSSKDSLIGGF